MDKTRVFIMGDLHGDFAPIRDFCTLMNSSYDDSYRIHEGDVLILLGDLGVNFFLNHRDKKFKERLGKYGLTYFVIRGNHDMRPSEIFRKNPQDWDMQTFFGGGVYVEKAYPYIKYALDIPFQYNINGHSVLTYPGAYSVDKYHRLKNGWTWFEDEQPNEAEKLIGKLLAESAPYWDIILSHTCPKIYTPADLFLSGVDQSLVDDSMERYLGEIERKIDYKLWCWGHFHATRIYPRFDQSDRVMLFNMDVLDLNKYFETDNTLESLITIHKDWAA